MAQTFVLKERAEDYTASQLVRMPIVNTTWVNKLEYYLFEDPRRAPQYLLGHPGYGKTLLTMRALNKGITERPDFLPLMLIYKRKGVIEALEPERLATKKVWGKRADFYKMYDWKELLKMANPIVVDDVHWACRAIIDGAYSADTFIDLLEQASVQAENGKKILLLSDGLLSFYSEKINNPRLDKLLPKFGSFRPDRVHELGYDYMMSVDAAAFYEIEPFPKVLLWHIARNVGYNVDENVLDVLSEISPRPRAVIRLLKLFKSKAKKHHDSKYPSAIDLDVVIGETLRKLEARKRPDAEIYSILLRMPVINVTEFALQETSRKSRKEYLKVWKSRVDFRLSARSEKTIREEIIPKLHHRLSEGRVEELLDEIMSRTPKYYTSMFEERRPGEAKLNDYILGDAIWCAFNVSLSED